MTYIRNLLRLFLSIIVGILFIIAMPIYDEPFSGCTTSGFATLELGCTLWLDVLLGFGTVLLIVCVGPNRCRPQLWGIAIVAIVASMGGLSAIKSGIYLEVLSHPANVVFYWRGPGVATFLGGLLGVGFYYLLTYSLGSGKGQGQRKGGRAD